MIIESPFSQYRAHRVKWYFSDRLLDFSNKVFSSESGQLFKKLIEDLVKPNPEERISVQTALQRLEEIKFEYSLSPIKEQCRDLVNTIRNHPANTHDQALLNLSYKQFEQISLSKDISELTQLQHELQQENAKLDSLLPKKEACYQCLYQIHRLRVSDNDQETEKFISLYFDLISNSHDAPLLENIEAELHEITEKLSTGDYQAVIGLILKLREENKKVLDIDIDGKELKATKLEQSLERIPVKKRDTALQNLEVQKALATHSGPIKKGTLYLDDAGNINEQRAAKSFHEFKKRFISEKKEGAPTKENTIEPDSSKLAP